MVTYRRNFVPGGSYFFTVTLRDRTSRVLVDRVDDLRAAYDRVHRDRPFTTDAIVILPDHLHCIWTLPDGDADYSERWRAIKSRFTMACRKAGLPLLKDESGAYDLWQRHFWEHTIRDEIDFENHAAYIHFNPVKHGHSASPVDWPHSSIHRYIAHGILNENWSVAPDVDAQE